MNATFTVDCVRLFKSLSKYMSFSMAVPILFVFGYRYVSSDFDYEKTFEYMTVQGFLIILFCIPVISVLFSLVAAIWYRLATIVISNGEIHGRNYWGMRNRIPLRDITELTTFSSNGINAVVVNSLDHGNIHISNETQRLEELLLILDGYLSEPENKLLAERD